MRLLRPRRPERDQSLVTPTERISDLKQTIRALETILASISSNSGEGELGWWINAPYLSVNERLAMTQLFTNLEDPNEVAHLANITSLKLLALVQSALTKHKLQHEKVPVAS